MKYMRSSIFASLMLLLAIPQLHAMNKNSEWGHIRDMNGLASYINLLSPKVYASNNTADRSDIDNIIAWMKEYMNTGYTTAGYANAPLPTIARLFQRLKMLGIRYLPATNINLESHYQKVTTAPNPAHIFNRELTLSGPAAPSFAGSQPSTSKPQNNDSDDDDDDNSDDSDDDNDKSDDSDSDNKATFFERVSKFVQKKFATAKTIECVNGLSCSFVIQDMDSVIRKIDEVQSTPENAEKICMDKNDAQAIRDWTELYKKSPKSYVPRATAARMLKRAHALTVQYAPIDGYTKEESYVNPPLIHSEKISSKSDHIFNNPLDLSSPNYGANFAQSALKLVQNRLVIAGGAVAAVAAIYWYYTKEAPEKSAQDDSNDSDEELETAQEIN